MRIWMLGTLVAAAACSGVEPLPSAPNPYQPIPKMEPMKIPDDNPMTAEKANLGRQLFFDKRLSGKGDRSCYSCHMNENGLAGGMPKNTSAVDGKPLKRHTPTLWNIGYHAELYWDGRSKSLEAQALAAWKLANMGAKDPAKDAVRADVIEKINKAYKDQFQAVFGEEASEKNTVKALACFMRTIISKTTAWDRYQAGDASAVTPAAKRGFEAFRKAKCDNCHSGLLFTSMQFYNVGIGMSSPTPDAGRKDATKDDKDTGKFKAPTLRDVARRAPYFHDGSVATLEEAVKILIGGGIDNPNLDRVNLAKADLSAAEIADLVEFLKSLTETAKLKEPRLP